MYIHNTYKGFRFEQSHSLLHRNSARLRTMAASAAVAASATAKAAAAAARATGHIEASATLIAAAEACMAAAYLLGATQPRQPRRRRSEQRQVQGPMIHQKPCDSTSSSLGRPATASSELASGTEPEKGWVAINLKGKDVLVKKSNVEKAAPPLSSDGSTSEGENSQEAAGSGDEMEQRGLESNVITHNALISASSKSYEVEKALEFFVETQQRGLIPETKTGVELEASPTSAAGSSQESADLTKLKDQLAARDKFCRNIKGLTNEQRQFVHENWPEIGKLPLAKAQDLLSFL